MLGNWNEIIIARIRQLRRNIRIYIEHAGDIDIDNPMFQEIRLLRQIAKLNNIQLTEKD